MCVHPIQIKNPNYGLHNRFSYMKDTTSQYINVPCGHCPECIAVRQMNWVQRVQMEQLDNHLFFSTLTYNNECMPIVSTSSGYSIRYAAVDDVQNMIKRLRRRNAFGRPFRYFGVSELGSRKGRPHFHILWMIPKEEGDDFLTCQNLEHLLFKEVLAEWKRNVAPPIWSKKKQKYIPNTRCPVYKPLCTYVRKFVRGKLRTNYDLHYANPILSDGGVADVAFYVLKYMMKPSDRAVRLQQALHMNLPEEEYEDIWKLVKPRHFESERFGLGKTKKEKDSNKLVFSPKIKDYIVHGMESSKSFSDFPCFISPQNGNTFPLARYYQKFPELYSMFDATCFYYRSNDRADNMVIRDRDLSQDLKKKHDFRKKVSEVDFKQTSSELDDLFLDL